MTGTSDAGGGQKQGRFLGSLREALAAAGREEQTAPGMGETIRPEAAGSEPAAPPPLPEQPLAAAGPKDEARPAPPPAGDVPQVPSAAEAAREARTPPPLRPPSRHVEADAPPTTRVVRGAAAKVDAGGERTQLVRGKTAIKRGEFHTDPVVGWLVIVGGPGLGSFRPIFEGNNTIGRADAQRIPIDFGDDAISSEEQAYIRYDSVDRSFLFVPNLAKTNVVKVNEAKPTSAVPLAAMDVITMGRTQLVFVPFCGPEFDWSALSEA